MHRGPAKAAAIVNMLVFLCLPLIGPALTSPGNSVTAYTSEWARVLDLILGFALIVSVLGPFAALAGWRTWVHAGHWLDGDRCWRGVLEAGGIAFALGFLAVGGAVGPNWFRSPALAFGYTLFYAVFAALIGLGVGVILQFTAMIVLVISALVQRVPGGG